MAEVRCPMCGKPNPDDLDVCQYCQARLKPLIIPPTPGEPLEEPLEEGAPPAEETPHEKKAPEAPPTHPDWLQPDWLQSLRQGGGTDELSEQTGQGESGAEEAPDWSAEEGIEGEPQESEPEGLLSPGEEAEATDWLDSLRPRSHIEREKPKPETGPEWLSEEKQPQEDIPEWLERIRSRQKSGEPEQPPSGEAAEAEEFLAGLRSGVSPGEIPPVEPQTPEVTGRHLDEEVEIP